MAYFTKKIYTHRSRAGGKSKTDYFFITNLEDGSNNPRGNYFDTKSEAEKNQKELKNKGYEEKD